MKKFRHLPNVSSLRLNRDACVGCGLCVELCPHDVLELHTGKAEVRDHDGCMECGACANNCPTGALTVTPGVGCASYIIQTWLRGKKYADAKFSCC